MDCQAGARPAAGAATSEGPAVSELTQALAEADIAVAGDGHAPL